MKTLLPLTLAIFSGACAFAPDADMRPVTVTEVPSPEPSFTPEAQVPPKTAVTPESLPPAKPLLKVEPLDEVGRYAVTIEPAIPGQIPQEVVRKDRAVGLVRSLGLMPNEGQLRDTNVISGETYDYIIGNHTFTVRVPRDLQLNPSTEITENIDIDGRLWFPANQTVWLKKMDLRIEADSIRAEGSLIRVFGEIPTAPGKGGSSAGTLIVKAREARGTLNLDLRGQNGVRGADGRRPSRTPGRAAAGRNAVTERQCNDLVDHVPCSNVCTLQPTDGHKGAPGAPGGSGQDGGSGGAGGRVLVLVVKGDDFRVTMAVEGGHGMPGGQGADGGPGQLGGAPGTTKYPCRNASIGFEGDTGARGNPGKNGAAGAPGEACSVVGTRREGRCNEMTDLISRALGED